MFLLATVHVHNVITVPTEALIFILGTASPIVTSIITKATLPSWAKACINAALATLGALIAVSIKQNGTIDVWHWVLAIGESLVLAWASYEGFWQHTVVPSINSVIGHVGIGKGGPAS